MEVKQPLIEWWWINQRRNQEGNKIFPGNNCCITEHNVTMLLRHIGSNPT